MTNFTYCTQLWQTQGNSCLHVGVYIRKCCRDVNQSLFLLLDQLTTRGQCNSSEISAIHCKAKAIRKYTQIMFLHMYILLQQVVCRAHMLGKSKKWKPTMRPSDLFCCGVSSGRWFSDCCGENLHPSLAGCAAQPQHQQQPRSYSGKTHIQFVGLVINSSEWACLGSGRFKNK